MTEKIRVQATIVMPKPFPAQWHRRVAASVLFVASIQWRTSRASNWAQVAGARVQNYAIPDESGAASPLFSPRTGMALTTTNTTTDVTSELGYSYIAVLGGDSFVKNTDMTAGERGGSYLNDVWCSGAGGWKLISGGTKPMTKSTMKWEEINPGHIPPAGVTYEEWIICQQGLKYRLDDASVCEDASKSPGIYLSKNMWSPRRNHRAVTVGVRMFVLGGRAREVADIARDRTEGGILSPRVENDPFYSSWREPSVLKNDVWASDDKGSTWFLVTPGCHAPETEDVLAGNEAQGKYGAPENKCARDADCYGVGECHEIGSLGQTTCVCPMWSPRELHAVAAHGSIIYVVGGFVSLRRSNCGDYACGNVDAGGYRGYKSDVWYSSDGRTWDAATLEADWPGRGDHGLFIYNDVMYLVGGAADAGDGRARYMNDVWYAILPTSNRTTDQPSTWYKNYTTPTWPGRAGHQVALEVPAAINSFSPRVYVIGGHNEGGILSDTWSWNVSEGGQWSEDYSEQQPYRSGVASTTGFVPGPPPQMYYLDGDSHVSLLKRAFLPTFAPYELGSVEPDLGPLVTDEEVSMLAEVGVHTVSDLISADRYTVLKLRGHGIPQICDLRNLAMALVEKCIMDPDVDTYDGEDGQPQNVKPVFPGGKPTTHYAKWYGIDYTVAEKDKTADVDVEELIEAWDGCTYVEALGDSPYVPGIGEVTQVSSSTDISQALGGLHCKINPGARTHAASVYFNQKLILIGGRAGEDELKNDAWYRDDRTPTAFVESRPSSYTSGSEFDFTCDEEVCYYEVRVFDKDENLEVVGWTDLVNSVDVSFLNRWTGGPGGGEYILYVRAVDSAGNTDFSFREDINMYTWKYVSPLPWGIIVPLFFATVLLIAVLYLEYRRRKKKRAMERYSMKRMRRKFKHQQKKQGVNWRDAYEIGATDKERENRKDDDGGGGGGRKKKKNKKDKKRDKKKKKGSGKTASSPKGGGKKKKKTSSKVRSKSKSRSKSKTPSKSRSRSKDRRSKSREKRRRMRKEIDKKSKKSKKSTKESMKSNKSRSRERSGTEKRQSSLEERRKKKTSGSTSKSKSKSKKTSNDDEDGREGRRFNKTKRVDSNKTKNE